MPVQLVKIGTYLIKCLRKRYFYIKHRYHFSFKLPADVKAYFFRNYASDVG